MVLHHRISTSKLYLCLGDGFSRPRLLSYM